MISDQDRSGWFGASDTGYIMGNWGTKTFEKWWLQKLGLTRYHIMSEAMAAGTYWEHAVLDFVGVKEKDKQILLPELSLRVNLDGNTGGHIVECKTHKAEKPYKLPTAHRRQVQVQMYAMRRSGYANVTAEIVSYGLKEYDYMNFFGEIDPDRLARHPIEFDDAFIQQYLARLLQLRDCLGKGEWPHEIAS